MTKWKKVKDELPKPKHVVLVWGKSWLRPREGYYEDGAQFNGDPYWVVSGTVTVFSGITHWRELPENPE